MRQEWFLLYGMVVPFMVDNGLSVVAVDEVTDKIVGTFIGYDSKLDEDS